MNQETRTPRTDALREKVGFDPEYPNQYEPFESLAEELELELAEKDTEIIKLKALLK